MFLRRRGISGLFGPGAFPCGFVAAFGGLPVVVWLWSLPRVRLFAWTYGLQSEIAELPVRIQRGLEDMLSGFLFQLRAIIGFHWDTVISVLYVIGDIVGMGAARGLRIVSQVFNDQRHVIGFARLRRTGDELIQSSGGVSRAVGYIRIHSDVCFGCEHRIVQPMSAGRRGDVVAGRLRAGRVERARIPLGQALRPVAPVVPVDRQDAPFRLHAFTGMYAPVGRAES